MSLSYVFPLAKVSLLYIVLLVVAIITFITDVVISNKPDYATFLLIMSTIIISGIISMVQETKSDNAAKKLKKMITNKIDLIRDEVNVTIDVEDVVPGDIVKLSSGDMIPGDVRFIETKDLFIDQSSLTGESNPIEKFSKIKECLNRCGNNVEELEKNETEKVLQSFYKEMVL